MAESRIVPAEELLEEINRLGPAVWDAVDNTCRSIQPEPSIIHFIAAAKALSLMLGKTAALVAREIPKYAGTKDLEDMRKCYEELAEAMTAAAEVAHNDVKSLLTSLQVGTTSGQDVADVFSSIVKRSNERMTETDNAPEA
jgi:hypothetical protein